jgi:hypothetical protein
MSRLRDRDGPGLIFMASFRRAIFHRPRKRISDVAVTMCVMLFKISSPSRGASLADCRERRQNVCARLTDASEHRVTLLSLSTHLPFVREQDSTGELTMVKRSARLACESSARASSQCHRHPSGHPLFFASASDIAE